MSWTPFGADPLAHATLVDGTPDWMVASLREWFVSEFRDARQYISGGTYYENRVARMLRMELEAHMRPFADHLGSDKHGAANVFARMNPQERLTAFDWLIRDNVSLKKESPNASLERILHDGGSKWKVGTRNGVAGLEERVPQGVQDAADAVMATAGQAGQLLSEAWHAAFGANPDPEDAYEKAIKAVEEAGAHVVSPKNGRATLGTMVKDMQNQGNWRLPLDSPNAGAPVAMAEALWQGQESRHGGNGYAKPTPEQAEAAVLLAVPLVQWFISGTLARR